MKGNVPISTGQTIHKIDTRRGGCNSELDHWNSHQSRKDFSLRMKDAITMFATRVSQNWVNWMTECVWHWASTKSVFKTFDRSKQITAIVVYYLGFDVWLQNDKGARESRVMHNQSVPWWQMEDGCGWGETKGCTQDLYKLLHLHAVAWEKKICGIYVTSSVR